MQFNGVGPWGQSANLKVEQKKSLCEKFGLSYWNDRPSALEYMLLDKISQLEERLSQVEADK